MGSSHRLKRKRGKLLSCFFDDDVLCSFRKSEKSGIMNRCFKCPFYKKFVEEMEKEEEDARDFELMQRDFEAFLKREQERIRRECGGGSVEC